MKKRNGVQLKLPMHTRAKVNLQPPQGNQWVREFSHWFGMIFVSIAGLCGWSQSGQVQSVPRPGS